MNALGLRQLADAVRAAAGRAAHWWLREFSELAPGWIVRSLFGGGDRCFTIGTTADGYLVTDSVSNTRTAIDTSSGALSDLVRIRRAARRRILFGLALPPEKGFVRTFFIPPAARKALPSILAQHLVHKTCFPEDLVYHDHRVDPVIGDSKRYRVRHVVVRKDIVDEAARQAGLSVADIDYVGIPVEEDLFRVRIRRQDGATGPARLDVALACGGIGLVVAACAIALFRQSLALDRLDTEVAAMKPAVMRAQTAKIRADAAAAMLIELEKRRRAPGVVTTLEALTKTVPDNGWLQGVQMDEIADGRREATVNGYATDAAGLVAAFARSNAFTDASLTSTVAYDAIEKRERFSLKAILKDSDASNWRSAP